MKNILKKGLIIFALICIFSSAMFLFFGNFNSYANSKDIVLNISGHNLTLKDNVRIKYYVDKDIVPQDCQVKLLLWTKPQSEYTLSTAEKQISKLQDEVVEGQNCMAYVYGELYAKNMTDVVYAKAYADYNGKEYYSELDKYSILEYCYNKTGKTEALPTEDSSLVELLNSMLDYGSKAQKYFKYKLDNLANDKFTYVRMENATFSDGFDYAILKAGTKHKINVSKGGEVESKYKDIISIESDGTYITVPDSNKGEIIKFTKHNWEQAYVSDSVYHWIKCADCGMIKDKQVHTFDQSGVCTVCGYKNDLKATEGIQYTINSDGNSYTVTGYTGNSKDLFIPSTYNNKPVTSIGQNAFNYCYLINSVIISDNVTVIGENAFCGCDNLISVKLPETLLRIDKNAFANCIMLYELTLPDSVTTVCNSAFNECYGLTKITVGKGLKTIEDNGFNNCYHLVEILNKSNLNIVTASYENGKIGLYSKAVYNSPYESKLSNKDDYVFYTENDKKILIGHLGKNKELNLPDDIDEINSGAFYNDCYILKVSIPDSVKTIKDKAFYNCINLLSVNLGKQVSNIETDAFASCFKLVEVYNKSGLVIDKTNNGKAGYYAKDIYTAPYTSKMTKDEGGYITYNDGNNVILMGYVGSSFDLNVPDSVSEIYNHAFSNLYDIRKVSMNNNVKKIGESAFEKCYCLTDVNIPESMEVLSNNLFFNCIRLEKIKIPGTVKTVKLSAFGLCVNLKTVIIGKGVTTIENDWFLSNYGLANIYYEGAEAEWNNITGTDSMSKKAYFYSETKPQTEGTCWHYDTDGITPVIW